MTEPACGADALTAERIGLTWLRAAVAPVGAFGRRHDETIAPYGPGDEMRALAEIGDVVALAARLDRDGVGRLRAALRAVPETSAIMARVRAGDAMSDVDFYELGRFVDALAALARAWDAAGGEVERRPPALDDVRDLLAPGREGGAFYLADAFAPGLHAARAALARAEERYEARRDAIAARVRDAIGVDPVGDEFVVLRDVHDGPLPDDVIVLRETPTYRAATLHINAPDRDDALARVATEEEAARRTLAERIAREADDVAAATRTLGVLDRLLARVAFTQRWNGCIPYLHDATNSNEPRNDEPRNDEPRDDERHNNERRDDERRDDERHDDEPRGDERRDGEPRDDERHNNERHNNERRDDEPRDDEPRDDERHDDERRDGEPRGRGRDRGLGIEIVEGTFAPLAEALAARGRRYTELTLSVRGAAVLTGPNMGGKSAALSALGFWCACVSLGVPPPARSAAMPLFEHVAWIGGEGPEDRARLLSSYAAEVVRARETLAHASPRALVLVDEFARTTGPREGRALLVAFVAALEARGARALVATHFDAVAEAAGVPHLRIAGLKRRAFERVAAADLGEALDAIDAAIDHRIVPAGAAPAESDALVLARLLGLDETVIARAEALYLQPER